MHLTKEEVLKYSDDVFDDFDSYLKVVNKGKILLLETQAKKLGFPVKEDEQPVGYRKVGHGYHYMPLFDRTRHMKYIPSDELKTEYGFEGDIMNFGIHPDNETHIGYTLHYGTFEKVFDIRSLIEQFHLKEVKTARFPIVRGDKINDFSLLSNHQDKLVGYKVLQDRFIPLFDLSTIMTDEKKELHQIDNFSFPLVEKWFFTSFKNKINYAEENCSGYAYNKFSGELIKLYDVKTVLSEFEPKLLNVTTPNNRDAIVPFEEFDAFEKKLLSSYRQFLIIKGITENDELIIQGPATEKWMNVRNQYTPVQPLLRNGNVLAASYGTEGIKPVHQCFSASCKSSSGGSYCGGFRGNKTIGDGMYEVTCEYRIYQQDSADSVLSATKGDSPLDESATFKQLVYVDSLLNHAGFHFKEGFRETLTKGQAGSLISALTSDKELSEELLAFLDKKTT